LGWLRWICLVTFRLATKMTSIRSEWRRGGLRLLI
jgi:hypothetical protein